MAMGLQKIKKQAPAPPTPLKKVPKGRQSGPVQPVPRGALSDDRVAFFGHSIQMLGNMGGFRWMRVNPDLTLTICTYHRGIKTIGPVDLCSSDRRHALDVLNEALHGWENDHLWAMSQADIELAKITKEWKK